MAKREVKPAIYGAKLQPGIKRWAVSVKIAVAVEAETKTEAELQLFDWAAAEIGQYVEVGGEARILEVEAQETGFMDEDPDEEHAGE